MKEISRQRKWQIEKRDAGLCIKCGKTAERGGLCLHHLELRRTDGRNRYRKKRGIPLDAPISKNGRKRIDNPKKLSAFATLVQAFRKFLKNCPTRKP